MGDELDINIIKSTQNSLGKYVKRPPLSEKLLKKPPFRFIHDIITSILKSNGFFKGLFEESELLSDNVKDRDSKIVFLTKIIFVVGAVTGKTLTVKPSKIIAGQEPEKTNELLQCIALALDSKLSSDEAVKQYKESVAKSSSTVTKSKSVKKLIKKDSDEKLNSKNVTKNDINATVKQKPKELRKKESPPKKPLQTLRPTPKKPAEKIKYDDKNDRLVTNDSLDLSISNDLLSKIVDENSDSIQNTDVSMTNNSIETEKEIILPEINTNLSSDDNVKQNANKEQEPKSFSSDGEVNNAENSYGNNEETNKNTIIDDNVDKMQEADVSISNNISVLSKNKTFGENRKESDTNEKKISVDPKPIRPLSVRPSSSRPGAPRLREKHEETVLDSDNLLIGKVNIIAENTVQEEDEEYSTVIIENDMSQPQGDEEFAHINSNEQHGHLVQQILDSQKEFSQVTGKTEVEWQFGAKKARDVANQEIDQLRFNLQALSRVANPLGKLLEHIQEDVEVMRQELQHWTKTYEDAHKELQKQKKSNEEKLKPLQAKIRQLDVEISDKQDKINDLKINIHKNASRIDKLLANGNKQ